MKALIKSTLIAATLLTSVIATAAPTSVKMACNLQVTSDSRPSEYLTSSIFYTSEKSVEIFGAEHEVALGYERYAAIITNSSRGMLVVLMDGKKPLSTDLITSENPDFKIKAHIDNLKFDNLELDCGSALIRTN